MKKLFTYLKVYKKESILAPLFKLLEASFELFVPLVVASIIDRGIGDGDRGYVLQMTLVLIALGLIAFSSMCLNYIFWGYTFCYPAGQTLLPLSVRG